MAVVIADPTSLREVRSAIQQGQHDIDGALARIRSTLKNARWQDDRRVQFEKDLENVLSMMSRFNKEADTLSVYLARKAEQLDRFLER